MSAKAWLTGRHWTHGYCQKTEEGQRGDCVAGTKGSFVLPKEAYTNWSTAAHACLEECAHCERCAHISLSVKWSDCGWFADCRGALQTDVEGFRTGGTGPGPGTGPPRAGRQHHFDLP